MSNDKEKARENKEALEIARQMRLGMIGRPENEKDKVVEEEKEQRLEPINYEDL